MRFLILTKRFYTNKDLLRDRFGRNFHLPIELGRLGHTGRVLAGDYRHEDPVHFTVDGVEFSDVPLSTFPPQLGLGSAYSEVREFEPDVIIGSSDVHFGAAAAMLARGCGIPFAYDLYDNYESFASARIPGMRALHHRLLKRADLVVCVSPALRDWVALHTTKTVVVGNGVDTNVFFPRPAEHGRRRYEISADERVVGYVGGISHDRGLEALIDAVALGRGRGQPLRLVLLGQNSSQLGLDLPWITVLDPVDQADVPSIVSMFDVAAWPYLDDAWGRFVHPNKLAEYLACGVPVVATDLPEFRSVAPYPGIEWYRPGDPADLLRALLVQIESAETPSLPSGLTWAAQGSVLESALIESLESPPRNQV